MNDFLCVMSIVLAVGLAVLWVLYAYDQIKEEKRQIAKCPDCGGYLISEDCFDLEASDVIIVKQIGHCENCKQEFLWYERYKLDEIEEIKKI